jgi:hypothetical protein
VNRTNPGRPETDGLPVSYRPPLWAVRSEERKQKGQVGEVDIAVAVQIAVGALRAARPAEVRQQDRQIRQADFAVTVEIAQARGLRREIERCFALTIGGTTVSKSERASTVSVYIPGSRLTVFIRRFRLQE